MTHLHSTRRDLMRGLTCCAGLPAVAMFAAGAAHAQTAEAVQVTAPEDITPDMALEMLKAGNAEFLSDTPSSQPMGHARRLEIASGQRPFAVLVGCSDSRVPPELLFNRGLGELFIVRVAGNTVETSAQGSVEYAVAELKVPLVVVLGHERCGAVHAAVEVVENNAIYPGSIGQMVEPIIPAVLAVREAEGDLLDNSVRANIERVVAGLKVSGSVIQDPLAAGKLRVIGARYDLDDGKVEFYDA
jgi:carbonic anhydrase